MDTSLKTALFSDLVSVVVAEMGDAYPPSGKLRVK